MESLLRGDLLKTTQVVVVVVGGGWGWGWAWWLQVVYVVQELSMVVRSLGPSRTSVTPIGPPIAPIWPLLLSK